MQFNLSPFETACPGVPQQPRLNPALTPATLCVAGLSQLNFTHHLTASLSPGSVPGALVYGTTTWSAIARQGHRVSIAFDWALMECRVLVMADMLSICSNVRLVDKVGIPLSDADHLIWLATTVQKLNWQIVVTEYLLRICPAQDDRTRC